MSTVTALAEFVVAHLAEFGGWVAVLGVLIHYLADISSKRSLQSEAARLTEKVNELSHELKLRESAYGKHLDLLLEYYSIFYRHYRLCQNATNQDAHQFPDGSVVKTRDAFFEQLGEYLSESKAQEGKARLVLPAHLLAINSEAIDAFNEFKDAMKRASYDEIFHESKRMAFAKIEAAKTKLEEGLRTFLRTEHLLKAATSASAIFAFAILTSISPAFAADIGVDPKREADILLSGPIEPGDAGKLLKIISSRSRSPDSLRLDSPGGSLGEAIRLARVIEKAAVATLVAEGGVCASACFFVWLAGVERKASSQEMLEDPKLQRTFRDYGAGMLGRVGLHRPFEVGIQSTDNRQSQIMRKVSEYLDEKLVPRRLIDSMMARPSNDIYWLTDQDLADLGSYPPAVEEFFIQKCGYDRNSSDKYLAALQSKDRLHAAEIKRSEERSLACEALELDRLGEQGRLAIKRGWRP